MNLSVIICTHNPRRDYLRRTLDALRAQTLAKEQWELLLIDNASGEPLAGQWDISWHPHARHIRENELGLTHARLRGIKESTGELLVFVDDDNVLWPDYLSNALKLTLSHSWVGAFGGNIIGEFETKPGSWMEVMLPFLAINSVKHAVWSFGPGTSAQPSSPCGAGLVIRRAVAAYYIEVSANDPLRRGLDRKGSSLVSAGDIDMALCACAFGLAIGRFPELQLTHLIPAKRLERDYLLRLAEESAFSDAVLQFIWSNGRLPSQNIETLYRLKKIYRAIKCLKNRFIGQAQARFNDEFKTAWTRGSFRAVQMLKSQQRNLTKAPIGSQNT